MTNSEKIKALEKRIRQLEIEINLIKTTYAKKPVVLGPKPRYIRDFNPYDLGDVARFRKLKGK